jgi:hypothetical protein
MGEVSTAETARLVSPAAAGAELGGISRQRVNKLAERWPEVKIDGKIDVERLKQLRSANMDPLKQMAYQHSERSRATQAEPPRPLPTRSSSSPDASNDADEPEQGELSLEKMDFVGVKTERERFNARLAQLRVLEEEGRLIPRDDVVAMNFAIARKLRDRISGFPTKLQQFIPAEAMQMLTDECDKLIKELQADAQRVAEGDVD